MKKLKNENELVKKAISDGMKYGEDRGVVEFEPTDSASEKIEYIYRLLVHDKVIQPVAIIDDNVQIGTSIGIAHYPGHADNEEDLIRKTDLALYEAKRDSGNTFRHYREEEFR